MAFQLRRSKKHDDVIVDRVTGVFHRRQLDADIAAGVDTSGLATATLLVCVDDFGSYTGRKGIASGDQVLERVSWVIMATVRTTDVVYRHTAQSFCVLLPATSDGDALAVADRIRTNVERMPMLAESSVTVSVGVASGTGTELAAAIERADGALAAGAGTGNRVFRDGANNDTSSPTPVRGARRERSGDGAANHSTLSPSASTPLTPPSH